MSLVVAVVTVVQLVLQVLLLVLLLELQLLLLLLELQLLLVLQLIVVVAAVCRLALVRGLMPGRHAARTLLKTDVTERILLLR
jgi:hypothetical protein